MVGPWKFLPCPECCGGCDYLNENWIEGIGSDWLEINTASGDWDADILGVRTASTGAAIVTTVSNPASTNFVIIKAQLPLLPDNDAGHEYKLIVDYVDEDNYYFAQIDSILTFDSPPFVQNKRLDLSIWQRSSGVDARLREPLRLTLLNTSGQQYQWWGCLSPSGFATTIGQRPPLPALGYWRAPTEGDFVHGTFWDMAPVSDIVGFGAGFVPSGGIVEFQDIQLTRHTIDEATCDPCVTCRICSGFPPEEFEVTVSGITSFPTTPTCHDDQSTLNDTYIVAYDHDATRGSSVAGVGCKWRFIFDGPCGIAYLEVFLNMTSVARITVGFFRSNGTSVIGGSTPSPPRPPPYLANVIPYFDCMTIDVAVLVPHGFPVTFGPETFEVVALAPAS